MFQIEPVGNRNISRKSTVASAQNGYHLALILPYIGMGCTAGGTGNPFIGMFRGLRVRIHVTIPTDGTGMGGITFLGTGGGSDDGLVFVAQGGDVFGLNETATETLPIPAAHFGTGRRHGDPPGVEAMAQGGGVISSVIVNAARATVMGIALLGTGSGNIGGKRTVGEPVRQSAVLGIGISVAAAFHVENHVGAVVKHIGARVVGLLDFGHGFGDHHLLQLGSIADTDPAQGFNTLFEDNGFQFIAEVECLLTDGLDRARDGDGGQAVAIQECGGTDPGHGAGDGNALQLNAAVKQTVGDLRQVRRQGDGPQIGTVGKGIADQIDIGILKGHRVQAGAASEGVLTNGDDILIEGDSREIFAVREGVAVDLHQG